MLDIAFLGALIAPAKQDHYDWAVHTKVDSESRSEINAEFVNSPADRFDISEIAVFDST